MRRLILALVPVAMGCSAASSEGTTAHTQTVGQIDIAARYEGDTIIADVRPARNDAELVVTFERASSTATLRSKYGQSQTLPVDVFPNDLDEATGYLATPLRKGTESQSPASGVKTNNYVPPPDDCLHYCYAQCDDAFPHACPNAVCRFGCYVGCTTR
jgi:hypothetical protein